MNLNKQFENLSVDTLQRWQREGKSENLQLEFKLAELRIRPATLGKAVSAFANSDGGLIVWGIACHKADGVDCVQTLAPIERIDQFITRLDELTGETVRPPVPGLLHRAIDAGNGTSFAATLVPASDIGPHMSRGEGRQYYKRNGSRSDAMEHFDVADMFGRRQRADLIFEAYVQRNDTMHRLHVTINVVNRGRGAAQAPMVQVYLPNRFRIIDFGISQSGYPGFSPVYPKPHHGPLYLGDANFVIHPTMRLPLVELECSYDSLAMITKHSSTLAIDWAALGVLMQNTEMELMHAADHSTAVSANVTDAWTKLSK